MVTTGTYFILTLNIKNLNKTNLYMRYCLMKYPCKRLKYSRAKKRKLLFLSCQMSEQDPEFRVILIEIKVTEINAPLN